MKTLMIFPNGQIAVCDERGEQIPELQKSAIELWCEHAVKHGFNPTEFTLLGGSGRKMSIFRRHDGSFNWGTLK